MANRIRSIKPEILEDEKTAFLSHLEYRLFTGSWIVADDYGNLRGDPDYLRCQIVWASRETRETVFDALAGIERAGLIARYTVRGQTYYHIVNFSKHQRIDKPGKAKTPGPDQADGSEPTDHFGNSQNPRESIRESFAKPQEILVTGSGSGILEREGERERDTSRSPKPPKPAKRDPIDHTSDHAKAIAEFHKRYEAKYSATPTWGAKQGASVNRLLKKLGYPELVRRIAILFDAPPEFLARSPPDIATLEQHIDKLSQPTTRAGPGGQRNPVLGQLLDDIATLERQKATP